MWTIRCVGLAGLFAQRLKAVKAPWAKRSSEWIADLDREEFATRKAAQGEVRKLHDLAEPSLGKALADSPCAEVSTQVKRLLEGRTWRTSKP
jgi:hypothetical protein